MLEWHILFSGQTTIGKLLRLPLRAIPRCSIVPILSGPNRGLRWAVSSSTHGCWLGFYERKTSSVLEKVVKSGMTVFDVGAHAGYFTLLLSRLVGKNGRVFSFEANADNVARLRRHLELNGIGNVEIIEAAVSSHAGVVNFHDEDSVGHIVQSDGRPVMSVCLDDFPEPSVIKMDIEGSETDAMKGASKILLGRRAVWVVAMHGATLEEVPRILMDRGYSVTRIAADMICAQAV